MWYKPDFIPWTYRVEVIRKATDLELSTYANINKLACDCVENNVFAKLLTVYTHVLRWCLMFQRKCLRVHWALLNIFWYLVEYIVHALYMLHCSYASGILD